MNVSYRHSREGALMSGENWTMHQLTTLVTPLKNGVQSEKMGD
jgi:hypothetical protein